MRYIVTRPAPRQVKMSLEDILMDIIDEAKLEKIGCITSPTSTRTYMAEDDKFHGHKYIGHIRLIDDYIWQLREFYEKYKQYDIFFDENMDYQKQLKVIKEIEKEEYKMHAFVSDVVVEEKAKAKLEECGMEYNPYYYTFYLPKRSGRGFRQIDAPRDEFKLVLSELKLMFEKFMCHNTYHTSAYAYIPNRSRVDLVKKLKENKTRWTLQLDFSNFFGSINLDWTMSMLSVIYPFSDIIKRPGGEEALKNCLRLCFLDGRLPQGTPISPLLTNILMIPIDYHITNDLLKKAQEITTFDNDTYNDTYRLIYTRYADDIFIGSHRGFNWKPVMQYIQNILEQFNAPMKIKPEKTKYKSTNGQNFILGLMYNQDYNITLGHKKKRQIKAMINNFAMDYTNHVPLDPHDIQVVLGNISHLHQIEPEYTDELLIRAREKYGFDILKTMKEVIYAK